ncbi:MarR family winged helix-turn-helix transcriptional regulator [Xanthobacter autotrophicus]|uniref:MarR family winged helix-turn-helix transcriptional regulator n=1 Tax=Xanthobacter autotrophicus TaxID=280 RepID=UPI0024A68943|nr:MarR family winged helix-turn-helix transcriptional regulator [Xanthobacter autotrophicus]MDI4654944.1 MarR family winged helix-turn-helix transcriptional regulator [Xanthobacter autotrophicus]
MTTLDSTLDLERFLPYRLNRVAAAVSEQLREVYGRKFGLTIPEWRVLATLAQLPRSTAREVGRHARLHKTKVSRAVQGLEERRWLSRVENPQDRREEFLSLTPLGLTTYRAIVPDMSAFEARLCAALGPDDTRAVRHVLDRLEDVLGLAGAPPPD